MRLGTSRAIAERNLTAELRRVAHSFLVEQAKQSAKDPKVFAGIIDALDGVLFTPDTEARVWFDTWGDMLFARSIIEGLEDQPLVGGVRFVKRTVDDKCATITYELSNGSAVLIGLKVLAHRTRPDSPPPGGAA